MWSLQASNSLPAEVLDFFKVQADADVRVSADREADQGRSLKFRFKRDNTVTRSFEVHINVSSESIWFAVGGLGSKPTDKEREAMKQLYAFINAPFTPEKKETLLYVTGCLIEYAREQTEAYARRVAAGPAYY